MYIFCSSRPFFSLHFLQQWISLFHSIQSGLAKQPLTRMQCFSQLIGFGGQIKMEDAGEISSPWGKEDSDKISSDFHYSGRWKARKRNWAH